MKLFVTTRLNTAIALHASGEFPFVACRLRADTEGTIEFVFRDDAGIGAQREAEYEASRALPVHAVFASQRWLRKQMTIQQNNAAQNRFIGDRNHDRNNHSATR
jgi:hypothetical protein